MGKTIKDNKYITEVLLVICLLIYAVLLVFLFYNQTGHMGPDENGYYNYESDLPYHIDMAENNEGYSLTSVIYMFCNLFPIRNHLIAIFLATCVVMTTYITYAYMVKKGINGWFSLAASMTASFIMPFFIKPVQKTMYIGYQSASIWHNSTYIVMKLLATLSVIVYLGIADEYKEKLSIKKLILFTVLLTMTTSVKSSFVMVFAPAALIMLIIDYFKGVPLKNLLLCSLSVIPAGIAMIIQTILLFDGSGENGIAFDFGFTAKYFAPDHPYLTMVLSLVFIIVVLLFNALPAIKSFGGRGKEMTDRLFWISAFCLVVGMLEFLCFYETGKRQFDGNFSWGYYYAIYMMTICALMFLYKNIIAKVEKKMKALKVIYVAIALGTLSYQTLCGIYYFLNLVRGHSYWM